MPRYAAALDQGTTGTRFMLFDQAGRIVASKYEEHTQIYPQPGWVEHDAGEIWTKTRRVIGGALAESGIRPREITGSGDMVFATVELNPGRLYFVTLSQQRNEAVILALTGRAGDTLGTPLTRQTEVESQYRQMLGSSSQPSRSKSKFA